MRILGSLIEKEATTPDAYPLTVNAVVLACNQKTAREPVMQLEADEVAHALRQLEVRGWVRSQHSGRAERYGHRVEKILGLTRAQAALLALLMLRGPQTLHELLGRSERLAEFASAEDVQHALDRLARREPALVRLLPRQSGQREARYVHLLGGEPDVAAMADGPGVESAPASRDRIAALEERIAELEARLARLEGNDPSNG
ncbi:YceH family protein [Lysobacter korlensis]|uniref:YceH family protein n=1 Tax=Lysobacter korlensis TaxID=553636 RepID=A0ABV6RSD4_9GAMM